MAGAALNDIQTRIDGPGGSSPVFVLAHGAGQDMDSPFMATMAAAVAANGIQVVRFNFPYMARAAAEGRRRPPDGEAVLLGTWRSVAAMQPPGRSLFIGGKSLGGRMASLVVDELGAAGLVCLGYPFHPPGRPEQLRTAHLEHLVTPALICQGTRDPFGSRVEVSNYSLSEKIRFFWLEDGDHGFRPRRSSGRTEAQNLADAAGAVAAFIRGLANL